MIGEYDYMETFRALVARIQPTRKRACPVNWTRHALFSSGNRLGRALKTAELSKVIIVQLTAQQWEADQSQSKIHLG